MLTGVVYFVVNEGEIVYSTYDLDEANGYAENATYDDVRDTAEEFGYDMDELDEDDIDEMAFASGFNGGYYYVDSVELPEDENEILDFVFTSKDGDRFTYSELEEVFEAEE